MTSLKEEESVQTGFQSSWSSGEPHWPEAGRLQNLAQQFAGWSPHLTRRGNEPGAEFRSPVVSQQF